MLYPRWPGWRMFSRFLESRIQHRPWSHQRIMQSETGMMHWKTKCYRHWWRFVVAVSANLRELKWWGVCIEWCDVYYKKYFIGFYRDSHSYGTLPWFYPFGSEVYLTGIELYGTLFRQPALQIPIGFVKQGCNRVQFPWHRFLCQVERVTKVFQNYENSSKSLYNPIIYWGT